MKNRVNRSVLRRGKAFLGAFSVTMFVSSPVWADDTEIFFGDLRGGGASPNVVFILDTSGSMSSQDGTGRSRIDRVKDGMRELVNSLNDVNIGLMRFSNPGGPVLYPVTYIDKKVGFAAGEPVAVSSSVLQARDDASEEIATGLVTSGLPDIRAGMVSTSGAILGGEVILTATVDDDIEDAHQVEGEDVKTSDENGKGKAHPIALGEWKNDDYLFGLRFAGLQIPPGATILSATLELTSAGAKKDMVARIRGDLPPAWNFEDGREDIALRANSVNSVLWDMVGSGGGKPANNEEITSPELKDLVQELVSDPDWEGDTGSINDIIFIVDVSSTNGNRRFHTVETDSRKAAKLNIRYSMGALEVKEFAAGIRFSEVNVPQNVEVTSAFIELEPAVANNAPATLTIGIEDSDAPLSFTPNLRNISSRPIADTVVWNSDGTEWRTGERVRIDVTSLMDDHVDRAAWCGGGAISFVITGDVGSRLANSYDLGSSNAPKLHTSYAPDSLVPGNSCRAITVQKRVVANADDGKISGLTASNTIGLSDADGALLRFTELPIPANASITSAYLKLYAGSDETGATSLSLAIEDTGDAGPLNGPHANFTGNVAWNITALEPWVRGNAYTSPDISGLIRTALAQGWSEDNSMLLQITKTNGSNRTIYAHDFNSQTQAAMLIVNFIDDGSQGSESVRDEFLAQVDSLSADGYTPIQDTLFEVYQYLTGGSVVWGKYRGGNNVDGTEIDYGAAASGPFYYTRVSAEGAITPESYQGSQLPAGCPSTNSSDSNCNDSNGNGQPKGEYLKGNPKYKSPIDNFCQAESHIIFLTDGIANEPHSKGLIQGAKDAAGRSFINDCAVTSDDTDTNSAQECVLELARYMAENDIRDGRNGEVPLSGDQRVVTHTIGFNFSSDWMRDIAKVGGGLYKEANSAAELVAEIEAILASVLKTDTSFVAPVAAINQFNRLTNLDDVYFAVFRPDDVPRWPGNLKRYKLGTYNGETNVLLDAEGVPAVSETTGFFEADSKSFWSDEEDGASVDQGGASDKFPSYVEGIGGRTIYTYLGQSKQLTHGSNAVLDTNPDLTADLLDVAANERSTHIAWIRGQDVDDENVNGITDEPRYIMSDPLHSRPIAVTYGAPDPNEPGPKVTIFMGTNGGFIHAFDAEDGDEEFAFIPKELLPNQKLLRANNRAGRHIYGIDGSIAVWSKDAGNNGITANGDDFVRLYVGQRRGGSNYYALDATDRSSPELMWQISGGSTAGFEEMGQSWARPIPGRVKIAGDADPRDVLFIAGGYDEDKDGANLKAADDRGRAIYIVDAITGDLVWSGGPGVGGFTKNFPEMLYSIPSGLTVADVDSDGFDDVIFVGDMGGQVWRFDIAKNVAVTDLVSGGVIAKLGVGGDLLASENRSFYHSPDVALVENNGKRELAVTIGSGKRPSPLSTAQDDRFYMLRQGAVFGPPAPYIALTHADLYDATANLVQSGTDEEKAAAKLSLTGTKGWYIDLTRSGEKVLSTPLSFRNTVTFTTYEPSNDISSCVPKAGTSRVYQLSLADASAVQEWDQIDGLQVTDRAFELNTPSIVDEPVIICTGAGCDLFTGAEKPPIDTLSSGSIIKTFWRQDQ